MTDQTKASRAYEVLAVLRQRTRDLGIAAGNALFVLKQCDPTAASPIPETLIADIQGWNDALSEITFALSSLEVEEDVESGEPVES